MAWFQNVANLLASCFGDDRAPPTDPVSKARGFPRGEMVLNEFYFTGFIS